MKAWQIWTFTTVLILIAVVSVGWAALWKNLASEWSVEASAAQYALNHSPLQSITKHDVFTGDGAEEVFEGKDAFGRGWYVMVSGTPPQAHSVQVQALKASNVIRAEASHSGLQVISTHLGYLDSQGQSQLGTNASFIWEVYGKTQTGTYQYAYYNAENGKLIHVY